MPAVIRSPHVEMERRRPLPIGCSEPCPPIEGPEKKQAQNAMDVSESGSEKAVQDSLNRVYVDRLTAEKNAAVEKASILEQELSNLKEQLESERKAASELGYKDGFQQAMDQVAAEQAKKTEEIAALLKTLSKEQCQLIEMAEEAAVEIGFAAAVKIIGEASVDHSLVMSMVKQAMRQISDREGMVVHLSAHDIQLVERLQNQNSDLTELSNITFKMSEQVGIGGCILETRAGSLDARLERQIQELKRLLIQAGDRKRKTAATQEC